MTNKIRAFGVLILAALGFYIQGCSRHAEPASAADGSNHAIWRLNWKTGNAYKQSLSVEQKVTMSVPELAMPFQLETEVLFEHRLTVLGELPNDGRELDFEFVSQKIESKSEGRIELHYDSKEDPSSDKGHTGFSTMRKMIGQHLDFKLDAAGNMLSVSNLAGFLGQVGGSRSNLLGTWFTEESVKQYCDLGHDLPGHLVDPGDHWPVKTVSPIGSYGYIEMQSEFNFKGFEQHNGLNCARLEFTGTTLPMPLKWISGIFVGFGDGTVSGVEWFDVEHGMLVERYIDQELNGKMIIKGKEISVSFRQTGRTQIERLTVFNKITHPVKWVRRVAVFVMGGSAWLFFLHNGWDQP